VKQTWAVLVMMMTTLSFFFCAPHLNVSSEGNDFYYVSPKGNDDGDGSINNPWRTIQKAANTLEAGDTVYVRDGVYREFVTIRNSGSKEAGYITYKAYPGEKPVLDGVDLTVTSGKSILLYLENASYIIVDGFELRNVKTSDPDIYPAGIRVREGGHDIHILNNQVHHIANTAEDGNAHGIHIYGNSNSEIKNVFIKNNEVHHLTLGSSEALTLSGNINGFLVQNNHVHHNNNIGIDIAGFYNACEQKCVDQARNGALIKNRVHDNSSIDNVAYDGVHAAGGIYADGATKVTIEKNIVYNNDFGIELASENVGGNTTHNIVQHNMVYRNNGAGILLGGASKENGGAKSNVIKNNILKNNDRLKQGYGEITFQWNSDDNKVFHNTILTNGDHNEFIQHFDDSDTRNQIGYNFLFPTLLNPIYLEKEKLHN